VSPPRTPTALLRAFVHDHLGAGVTITDSSRRVGRQSVVWRIDGDDGFVHYLKQHEALGLYERARMAYTDWTPQLEDGPCWHVPRVIAQDDELGILLLEALPGGTRVSELPAGPAKAEAYRAAGCLLRALHDLPVPERPEPVAHMRAQIDRYVRNHAAVLDAGTRSWLLQRLDDGRPFAGAPIVCTHRDYSPRNWAAARVHGEMIVSVFDWERAEVDCAFHDMQRMEYDHWLEAPDLKHAFLDGYGGGLSPAQQEQLDLVVLINAVASVAWARDRGDTPFERLAQAAIDRLQARDRP